MEKKETVSDSEWEILEVLWEAGEPLCANDIRERLNKKKNWERTTVLTLIKRLCQKNMLIQEKREVFYYAPSMPREDYVKKETKNFVNKFFRGSSRNLAAALVSNEDLTKEDIKELREYFNKSFDTFEE